MLIHFTFPYSLVENFEFYVKCKKSPTLVQLQQFLRLCCDCSDDIEGNEEYTKRLKSAYYFMCNLTSDFPEIKYCHYFSARTTHGYTVSIKARVFSVFQMDN